MAFVTQVMNINVICFLSLGKKLEISYVCLRGWKLRLTQLCHADYFNYPVLYYMYRWKCSRKQCFCSGIDLKGTKPFHQHKFPHAKLHWNLSERKAMKHFFTYFSYSRLLQVEKQWVKKGKTRVFSQSYMCHITVEFVLETIERIVAWSE